MLGSNWLFRSVQLSCEVLMAWQLTVLVLDHADLRHGEARSHHDSLVGNDRRTHRFALPKTPLVEIEPQRPGALVPFAIVPPLSVRVA